jgi:hypothetical protein
MTYSMSYGPAGHVCLSLTSPPMNNTQSDSSRDEKKANSGAAQIAIVLPTRNRPALALATIRSLLHQLRPDTQLIVIGND